MGRYDGGVEGEAMDVRILIVEDDPSQREVVAIMLRRKLGYDSVAAGDGRTALAMLREDADIALVILDAGLPDMAGTEVLEIITQRHPGLPVVMLTGSRDVELAVEAMKAGACDFLTKPPEKERLQVAIRNALKTSLLESEVLRLRRQEAGAATFVQLTGCDTGLSAVTATGRKAAASDIPVMLTGETGTGKEVFARAIHGESRRAGNPFVAVNCGAIPAQLVESTLFGHEKGAFTGAIAKAAGKFREAGGGTIFLDEVGELPPEAQVKLLRVLQQKEVSPVGADRPVPVNVRVISATNRDLEAEVAQGRFREDLYFRLNVLPIRLPPLRERAEDIPDFVQHFVGRFAAAEGRAPVGIAPEALGALSRRRWPGNVRELENAVHRAMVLCEGAVLTVDDFPDVPVAAEEAGHGGDRAGPVLALTGADGEVRTMESAEAAILSFALQHYGGNMTRAAAALGIAKSTFYRRVGQLRGNTAHSS